LIKDVAKRANITRKQAGIAVEMFFDEIRQGLRAGHEAYFINFGRFTLGKIGKAPVHNYGGQKKVVFKPGKELKDVR